VAPEGPPVEGVVLLGGRIIRPGGVRSCHLSEQGEPTPGTRRDEGSPAGREVRHVAVNEEVRRAVLARLSARADPSFRWLVTIDDVFVQPMLVSSGALPSDRDRVARWDRPKALEVVVLSSLLTSFIDALHGMWVQVAGSFAGYLREMWRGSMGGPEALRLRTRYQRRRQASFDQASIRTMEGPLGHTRRILRAR
jgi:hypothetical protein